MARPRKVLGEKPWLVAGDQVLQAPQMVLVEGLGRADRQAHPVQRQRIALADRSKVAVRHTYLWKFQIDLLRFSKKGESEDGPFKVGFVPAHWNRLKIKENTIDRA